VLTDNRTADAEAYCDGTVHQGEHRSNIRYIQTRKDGMVRQHWMGFDRGQRHFGAQGLQHGRPFKHGDLRYIILQLIADKPRHGYKIIKAIEEQLGGLYSLSPGVVNPP
jgi:hypothetical protein